MDVKREFEARLIAQEWLIRRLIADRMAERGDGARQLARLENDAAEFIVGLTIEAGEEASERSSMIDAIHEQISNVLAAVAQDATNHKKG